MNRRVRQPALPVAAMAAAMVLSISASADASLIASLMQTGQPSVSLHSSREGISDWLTRLSHAAHQLQSAFHADAVPTAMVSNNAPAGDLWLPGEASTRIAVDMDQPKHAPLRDELVNLPPPAA